MSVGIMLINMTLRRPNAEWWSVFPTYLWHVCVHACFQSWLLVKFCHFIHGHSLISFLDFSCFYKCGAVRNGIIFT